MRLAQRRLVRMRANQRALVLEQCRHQRSRRTCMEIEDDCCGTTCVFLAHAGAAKLGEGALA
jgi:hypothetical protein